MTDRFSTFAVIRGIMTVPEAVPEKKPEGMPEKKPEGMPEKLPEREIRTISEIIPETMPVTESEETPVSGENMTALAPERTEKETAPSMTHIHAPDTGDNTPDICGFFTLFLAGMFIICWICAICWPKIKNSLLTC